jgi:predicted RNA-binding Zn ribbon-like protein
VLAFINSANLERGWDLFDTSETLSGWLHGRGLLSPQLAAEPGDLEVVLAVREALRDLAGANCGQAMPAVSSERLDAVSQACGLRPRFEPGGGVSLAPELGGVAGALGRLLGIVVAAVGNGQWQRVKTCRNPACRWAFHDRTRNGSGVWCDMALCGSRAKSRRYYAMHRSGSGAA